MSSDLSENIQFVESGQKIMGTDGGMDALMNLANEVAGVSSEDMRSTLTSQIDKVRKKPTARNVGQLYATVQAANNQTKASVGQSNATPQTANDQVNTAINQADVATSLISKGISSKKADGIAEAIVARLNGQELTRPQRNLLNSALNSSAVRDTISEFLKKKVDGVDSAQNNVYDNIKDNGNRYEAVEEDADLHQVRDSFSAETYENGPEVIDNIITDGSHLENGKLKPNVTYKTGEHDYFYTTNGDGLIVNARTDNLQEKEHERRLKHNPNTYGKEPGDHAGHLFADRFGGSPELDNLVSQAKNVNWREYGELENQWAHALRNGQKVTVNIDIHYSAGSVRPVSFDVSYTIDGVRHRKIIKNQ